MLSHDNLTYTTNAISYTYGWGKESTVSFLPFSHIAGVLIDIFQPLQSGGVTYCADKNALRGTLVSSLFETS
jgi:long-chain-fatty-acid--CoA ligase ACSBG